MTALDDALVALANLRHLHTQMRNGDVRADAASIANAARGLLGPAIASLERVLTPCEPADGCGSCPHPRVCEHHGCYSMSDALRIAGAERAVVQAAEAAHDVDHYGTETVALADAIDALRAARSKP